MMELGRSGMISVILATHNDERLLVPTLAALVPGAVSGLVREVLVADGGSSDGTVAVAELAGCRLQISDQPKSARLKGAAGSARSPWLMFLRPGIVPQPEWRDVVEQFLTRADAGVDFHPIGVFATTPRIPIIHRLIQLRLSAVGLVVLKKLYVEVGGHDDTVQSDTALLRRLGRSRASVLPARVVNLADTKDR